MNVVLVLTNFPSRETAVKLAEQLVAAKLAACINILAPCLSIYHWQEKTESTEEITVLIKTTENRYEEVQKMIRNLHPYELPEILCVPVAGGLPEYLQWVAAETLTTP